MMSSQDTHQTEQEQTEKQETPAPAPAIDPERRAKIIRRAGVVGFVLLLTAATSFFIANQPNPLDINGHSRWWSLLVIPFGVAAWLIFYPKAKEQLLWRFLLPIGLGLLAVFLIENWSELQNLANAWNIPILTRRGSPEIPEVSLRLLYGKIIIVCLLPIAVALGLEVVSRYSRWKITSHRQMIGEFLVTILLGLLLVRGVEVIVSVLIAYLAICVVLIAPVLFPVKIWQALKATGVLLKKLWQRLFRR